MRSKVTGSLHLKNGIWQVVLNFRGDSERKQKWISTHLPKRGNKRKAEAFMRQAILEQEEKFELMSCDILFICLAITVFVVVKY
ncbi:MAG: hypothetical protein HFJ84_05355 [Clostridiales bacterium]|jgi:hypothetical protein|nr:hypothetical protein [Clostridiales bacterium]